MKCIDKDCDGEMTFCYTAKGKTYLDNHKRMPIPEYSRIRLRKCKKCGKKLKIIEMPLDKFQKDVGFMAYLKEAMDKYTTG